MVYISLLFLPHADEARQYFTWSGTHYLYLTRSWYQFKCKTQEFQALFSKFSDRLTVFDSRLTKGYRLRISEWQDHSKLQWIPNTPWVWWPHGIAHRKLFWWVCSEISFTLLCAVYWFRNQCCVLISESAGRWCIQFSRRHMECRLYYCRNEHRSRAV